MIAEKLSIHEKTLYGWLRYEMSTEKKKKLMTFLKKRRSIDMYRTRDDGAANIKLELPEDTLIVKRADLREIVHEVLRNKV